MKRLANQRAGSTVEYMALIMFVLSAFFIFQHYIVRAFHGQWRKTGDSFGQGRQYDPRRFAAGGTRSCRYWAEYDRWLESNDYEACMVAVNRTDCLLGLTPPDECN